MGSERSAEFEAGGTVMTEKKYAAVVLSAGKGTRMNSAVPKQYMMLEGKPVLYYSLYAFEKSMIDEIVLVTGEEDVEYCRKEIVQKYGFTKIISVTAGGKERYHSVFCGLTDLNKEQNRPDYVMIHDGARPFINDEIIWRCVRAAEEFRACAAGVPAKDTIKIADESLFVRETPKRKYVWQIQTPQAFAFPLIYQAYEELLNREQRGEFYSVTDDTMVLEAIYGHKVKLVEGSYENIKITTPEDLKLAKAFLPE
jgi:2-C-methyl-D-erythritol 4-phosphate cytidylyltransferase